MRKRNYVMGLVAVLAVSVAVPAVAHAAITGTTITASVTGTKQEKKVRGGIGLDFTTNTAHTFPDVVPQTASNATVDFDKDFAFTSKGLPTCNPTKLANTTTDQALAACPGKRKVGSGDATLCSFAGACGAAPGGATGVVTAFNGTPSGGALSLLLHTRTSAGNTTVLDGTLVNSPVGGSFGKRLNVNVPDTSPTGQELTIFHTNIPKTVVSKKKNKKTGKTVKTFYLSAKCSADKIWQFQASFIHRNGGPTTNGATQVPCKVKKPKKK
jgi:hypothetical protein